MSWLVGAFTFFHIYSLLSYSEQKIPYKLCPSSLVLGLLPLGLGGVFKIFNLYGKKLQQHHIRRLLVEAECFTAKVCP